MDTTEKQIPSNFRSVIFDFTNDLSITFPEYAHLWNKWSKDNLDDAELKYLFNYCLSVYPERFFDILYQSSDVFKSDNTINTFFLPNVDFKTLFNCEGVSENTIKTMWKYLQLVLFTVVGGIRDKSTFGDTMNMFDGINEKELQEKLNETMSNLTDFFKNLDQSQDNTNKDTSAKDTSANGSTPEPNFDKMFENMPGAEEFKNVFSKMNGIPNMEGIQDHLKSLFDGKIGKLAKDMAEEITNEFSDILGADGLNSSSEDVMKNLMQNPKKLMELMKTVGNKLDGKMKGGEISKDELMKEAGDLINKMKEMGGADQFNDMFKNLAKNMGGLSGLAGMAGMAGMMGKNMKFDKSAFDRMTKEEASKERLRKQLAEKKLKKEAEAASEKQQYNYSINATSDPNNFVFKLPDGGEQQKSKSYIHPDVMAEQLISEIETENATKSTSSNKKKKNKQNKNK